MHPTPAARAARLSLAAALTLVAACGGSGAGGGGGGGAGASPPRKLAACKYDFQANVTQGPDSGLSLRRIARARRRRRRRLRHAHRGRHEPADPDGGRDRRRADHAPVLPERTTPSSRGPAR